MKCPHSFEHTRRSWIECGALGQSFDDLAVQRMLTQALSVLVAPALSRAGVVCKTSNGGRLLKLEEPLASREHADI